MRFGVLGPLAVQVRAKDVDLRSAKQRILLARLLASANRAVSPQLLVEALWETPPASATDNLRVYIYQLRRALGDNARITHGPEGYALTVRPGELDVDRFAERVAAGMAALDQDAPALAATELAAALAEWRGPAYGELAEHPTVRPTAMALDEQRVRAVELRIDADLRTGRHAEVIGELVAETGAHPFREHLHAQLMTALALAGRQAEALDVYRRVRAMLVDELGVEPGPALRDLHARLLRGEAAPAARAAPMAGSTATASGCPYLGLLAYQAEHRSVYFGRAELLERVLAKVERQDVVAVIGASGSGKSSLLRAGLVGRRVDDPAWRAVVLTPTRSPLDALAKALSDLSGRPAGDLAADLRADPATCYVTVRTALADGSPDTRLLLVVDQVEELFTLSPPSDDRDRFIAAVLDAAVGPDRRVKVVLGVRADFIGALTGSAALFDALGEDGTLLVGPVSRADLREIILMPARRAGVSVDADLLATMQADLGDVAGPLPLLSHALRQTWHNRAGDAMTLAAYQASGGVRGAIAMTAERLYEGCDAGERAAVRRIFLRLTALGEGTDDTSRPIQRAELAGLAAPEVIDGVLDRLVRERLVVVGEHTIAVAHEAVINAWPRLHRWLGDDRADLVVHRRLTVAAHTWRELDEDTDALYRGAQQLTAAAWAERHAAECNEVERAFLLAGQDLADRELVAARRRARQLKRFVTALALLLVVATVAAVVAVVKGREAGDREAVELAHRVAGIATGMIGDAPDTAGLLAIEAYRIHPDPDTLGALLSTSAAAHRRIDLNADGRSVYGAALSPDGRTVASADVDGAIRLWDIAGRELAGELVDLRTAMPDASAREVIFDRTGGLLAGLTRAQTVGPSEGMMVVWDLVTREAVFQQRFESVGTTMAFSRDGTTLAVGTGAGVVEVWDVRTRSKRELAGDGEPIRGVAISPTGAYLVSSDGKTPPVLWDLPGGRRLATVEDPDATTVAFDSVTDTFITSAQLRGVRAWRVTGGHVEPLSRLPAQPSMAWDVSEPVGDRIAVVDENGKVAVWDLVRGQVLAAHDDRGRVEARSVVLGQDGSTLVSAGLGQTIVVRRGAVPGFGGHGEAVSSLAISPDGETIASGGYDRVVRLWNRDGDLVRLLVPEGGDRIEGVAFSPDGAHVIAVGRDHTITKWVTATGKVERSRLYSGLGATTDLAIAPDGRTLVTTSGIRFRFNLTDLSDAPLPGPPWIAAAAAFAPSGDLVSTDPSGSLMVWNGRTDTQRHRVKTGQGSVHDVAVSSDGASVATAGADRTVRVWDSATGAQRAEFACAVAAAETVAFSLAGDRVAAACADRTITVWDLATGTRITTLTGHSARIRALLFLPGGDLLSAADDTRIIRWPLSPDTARARICDEVARDLTEAEWHASIGTETPHPICATA
ncbi:High-affnity carbon uptake protein Hat/HatR [Alloactinosynnema sp. L-07]|uniref:nSTAND1 domain-containing NTPase n=1 Tax=Alloactinosynnema sp. L-07 TaxID=1653480 RepID=UPI00065F09CC|nr:BTAD domain-containing putative transcriptional regulator [Alloactinosynnema sp. L-07]CRK56761.1 High-affnity carbon uptake protein Hat/HatR [Alloactinosynnema sp. L-07]